MKRLIILALLLSGCGIPGCMTARDCKEMCGDQGVHYFGPVRGNSTGECICNNAARVENK